MQDDNSMDPMDSMEAKAKVALMAEIKDLKAKMKAMKDDLKAKMKEMKEKYGKKPKP